MSSKYISELHERIRLSESNRIFAEMQNRMYETDIRKLERLINIFKKRFPDEYSLSVEELNQRPDNR